MDEEIEIGKDIDISKALKDFEVKSEVEAQQQKGVTTDNFKRTSWMVRLVIKCSSGTVKNEAEASNVLLVIAIFFFMFSFYLFFGDGLLNKRGQSVEDFKKMFQTHPDLIGKIKM
jgi:hypothetical protein